jgi:hypothetical protein
MSMDHTTKKHLWTVKAVCYLNTSIDAISDASELFEQFVEVGTDEMDTLRQATDLLRMIRDKYRPVIESMVITTK